MSTPLEQYTRYVSVFVTLFFSGAYELADDLYNDLRSEDLYADQARADNDERRTPNDEELNDALKNLPANDELFEGDMVMDSRLRNAVLGVSKKSVVALEGIKWPNGVLVYEVDPDFLEGKNKTSLFALN